MNQRVPEQTRHITKSGYFNIGAESNPSSPSAVVEVDLMLRLILGNRRTKARRRQKPRRNFLRNLILEPLENRNLLAALTATKDDGLAGDVDGDGVADPGDRLRYAIEVTNTSGADVPGVRLTDDLDGMTIVDGSLNVGPIAFDDVYTAIGNTAFDTRDVLNPLPGLLGNDAEFLGDTFSLATVDDSGVQGTLDVSPDGHFSYLPPLGFTGTESFRYTITDGTFTSQGAVTIDVQERVWYVDNQAGAGGDGRSHSRFNTLTAAQAAASDGDTIFVFRGDGTDSGLNQGISLRAGQRLAGEGTDLVLAGRTVVAGDPARKPLITNPFGNGVMLSTNNTVRGIEIGDTPFGPGLSGFFVGDLTVDGVSISGQGQAINLFFGHLDARFDDIASTGTFSEAIMLNNISGTLEVTGNTTIADAGSSAIGIFDSGATGNRFDFGDVTITDADLSPTTGVFLNSTAGAEIVFDSLDITTSNGAGLTAFNGGTVIVAGADNRINATGGRAIEMIQTNLGPGTTQFSAISSRTRGGLSFIQVGGGKFVVDDGDDTTTTDLLVDGADNGVLVTSSTASFEFSSVDIDNTTGAGVDIQDSAGPFLFANVDVNAAAAAGISLTDVGAVTIAAGQVRSADEAGLDIDGGAGNILFAGDITNTAGRSVEITGRNGGTVELSGSITDTGSGVLIEGNSAGAITISGPSVLLNTGSDTALKVSANVNTEIGFTGGALDVDTAGANGIVVSGGAQSVRITGANNRISTTGGTALSVDSTPLNVAGLNFAEVSVDGGIGAIVLNNTGAVGGLTIAGGTIENVTGTAISLTNVAAVSLGSLAVEASRTGIEATVSGTNRSSLAIDQATVSGTSERGIDLNAGGDGVLVASLSDNALTGGLQGLDASTISSGAHLCLAMSNNTGTVQLNGVSGTFDVVNRDSLPGVVFNPDVSNFNDVSACPAFSSSSGGSGGLTSGSAAVGEAASVGRGEAASIGDGDESEAASLSPSASSPVLASTASSAPSPQPANSSSKSLNLTLDTIPAGRTVSIVFEAVIDDPLSGTVPQVSNQAVISATGMDDVLTDDPDLPGDADPTVTVVDSLSVGDLVWDDINNDSQRDAGEPGIAGVVVNIYRDTNGDGQFSPGVDTFAGTDTTDHDGIWQIDRLLPGSYIAQVAEANFAPGNALFGMRSSLSHFLPAPSPDLDEDGDDNGYPVAGHGTVTLPISLEYNSEPTRDGDADTNLTVDFGFTEVAVDLAVTHSIAHADVVAGSGAGNVMFEISVVNGGPSDASDVVVDYSLDLPSGVSVDSITPSAGGSFAGGVWTVGAVASGDTATLTILATADAAAVEAVDAITSRAQLTSVREPETERANDQSTAHTSISRDVDLRVAIAESADAVVAGSGDNKLTYVVTVTNRGPSDATGVRLNESTVLPAGTVVTGVSASGSTAFAGSAGTGVWDVGTLASGSSATLTVTITVGATTASGVDVIGHSAELAAVTESLTNTADDTATERTGVTREVDLVVAGSEQADPVVAGHGQVRYTVSVTNRGPSQATGVVLNTSATLPAGVTVASVIAENSTSFAADAWTVGELAPGETVTLVWTATVGADAPIGTDLVSLTVAVASAGETLVNPSDDTATLTSSVVRESDLALSVSQSATTVVAGSGAGNSGAGNSGTGNSGTGNLSFTVTVTNNGPSAASGVIVSQTPTLPRGVSIDAVVPDDGTVFFDGQWNVGTLLPGEAREISWTFTVGPDAADGTDVIQLASAVNGADSLLIQPANDRAVMTASIARETDLTLSIGESTDRVVAGADELVYIVTLVNGGPSDASGVIVDGQLNLPDGVSLVSVAAEAASTWDGNTWRVDNLPAGGTVTLTWIIDVTATADPGTDVVSLTSAVVGTNDTRVNLGDDAATESTSIVRETDVSLHAVASSATVVAGGDSVALTVSAANHGPSAAGNVAVRQQPIWPAGTQVRSVVASGSTSFAASQWTVGSLLPGQTETLTWTIDVDESAQAGDLVELLATLNQIDEPQSNVANDAASATVRIARESDLAVGVEASANRIVAGSSADVQFVATVTNHGPSAAGGIVLDNELSLPAGVTLAALAADQGTGGADEPWTLGDLEVGESATLTWTVRADASAPQGADLLSLSSSIVASTDELIRTHDDSATASVSIDRESDLVVTVAESTDSVLAGSGTGNLTYTVTVANRGVSDASGVALSGITTLPDQVTVDRVDTTGLTQFDGTNGTGTWHVGTLPAGSEQTMTLVLTVHSLAAAGSDVVGHSAAVSQLNEVGVRPEDDADAEFTDIERTLDLAVSIAGPDSPIVAGSGVGNVTYTVTVTNVGTWDATGVVLNSAASLPEGTSIVSKAISESTSFDGDGLAGNWVVGDLAVGESRWMTVTATADATVPDEAEIIASAAVSATNEARQNIADDSATRRFRVARQADLAVTLVDSPDSVLLPGNIGYTIEVTNNGPAIASDVVVAHSLADLVVTSVTSTSGSVSTTAGRIVTSVAELAVGGTVRIHVAADVTGASRELVSSVEVAAAELDPAAADNSATVSTPAVGPGSLSGFSYIDENNDGLFQSSDHPIGGTVIVVTGTDVLGREVARTTTTGTDGAWRLENIVPGRYRLRKVQSMFYLDGKDTAGSLGGVADSAASTIDVTVPPDAIGTDYNFAERDLRIEVLLSKRLFITTDTESSDLALTVDLDAGPNQLALPVSTDAMLTVSSPDESLSYTLYTSDMQPMSSGDGTLTAGVQAGGVYILEMRSDHAADGMVITLHTEKMDEPPPPPADGAEPPAAGSTETPESPVEPNQTPGFAMDYDTNDDGSVTPIDALLVVSGLRDRMGYTERLDVNGDGNLTSADALLLIRRLNDMQRVDSSATPVPSAITSQPSIQPAARSGVVPVIESVAAAIAVAPAESREVPSAGNSADHSSSVAERELLEPVPVMDGMGNHQDAGGSDIESLDAILDAIAPDIGGVWAMSTSDSTQPGLESY